MVPEGLVAITPISILKLFLTNNLCTDLTKVSMSTGDIFKTAVNTPFGLFEWLRSRMPFSLRNSGCTFQRLTDQIFQGLRYCFVYVDDVLIFSPDLVSHLEHVRTVFDLLRGSDSMVSASTLTSIHLYGSKACFLVFCKHFYSIFKFAICKLLSN